MNLTQVLGEAVGRYGGKPAIISGNRRLSFADLAEASNKVAGALLQMGVERGDRVALLLSNGPDFAVSYFGIAQAGAIAVPLDTKYKVGELTSLLEDCQPKVLVTESPCLESLIPVISQFQSIRQVIDLGSKYEGRFISYRQIMAGSAPRIEVEPGAEDIALIAYTAGPSFQPRGVVLSHRSLVLGAIASAEGFQQTERDIVPLFALPLHHMFGLVSILLASIHQGSSVVMVPATRLSINSLLTIVERERATMLLGVPYIFALAVDFAEKEGIKSDLSSLRLCVSAGAPLAIDIVRRFKQLYGFDLLDCWGLTEAACHNTCPPLDGSGGRPGSVGKALSGWEVKIVADDGRELPPNQAGEIIISGQVMKGYYHNPQATAAVMRDGWVYTGDIGKVDDAGNLFITGRKKDMIIIKGQNIYPSDIECVLLTHPKVVEVAVLGIPDELRGETIVAVIRLQTGMVATEWEIKQFCLERLANYKVPKQVIFVDSLPQTAAGKIDKEGIREQLAIPSVFPGST